MIKYINNLEVTEAEPIIDYVLSFGGLKENLDDEYLKDFKKYLEDILDKEEKIRISKDTGIFISKKPK